MSHSDTAAKPPITAARVHRWINIKTFTDMFGVQVRAGGKWHHLAIENEAALFPSVEAAQQQAAEIMRQAKQ